MTNLTSLQESLIDGLKKEFSRINPQVTNNSGGKRFTFDTLDECKNEEAKFLETITKHNLTMIKVFDKQFTEELKNFKKEFGKVFNVQLGYTHTPRNGGNTEEHHTYENFIKEGKRKPLQGNGHNEMYFFIVSKTKTFDGESRYDYCKGYGHTKLYVDFKRERVTMVLQSGKEVTTYKIVGLEFAKEDYLNRDRGLITSTLDEYIQTSKPLQGRLVELSQ